MLDRETDPTMLRFCDYSIPRKLAWMNLLVSGAALLLACGAFVAYDLISFRESMVLIFRSRPKLLAPTASPRYCSTIPSQRERPCRR